MSELRQVVLLAADLGPAIASVRDGLGLNRGVRDEAGMAAIGFEHEVLAIDETFVEIVSPLTAESPGGRLLARRGECGYMVVVQVSDLAGVVHRAAQMGFEPVLRDEYEGNPISQWHPHDLGTLAEIDEVPAGAPWHLCPALSDTGSTDVVADIVAVTVAVPDPAATAQRWADLLGTDGPRGTELALGDRTLEFVAGTGGLTGVVLRASAPGRTASFTACGVTFTVDGSR